VIDALRRFQRDHPVATDVILISAVTIAAAVLRLALLGRIPYGVHPDEAQLGTDGRKILDGELWTVYTTAVLGQPSGHAYLTLPSFLVFGWTPFAMRLPLALVGLAAVPLLYLLVRTSHGRSHALFASSMLAVSYWHLFYSRVAHWSISYGTVLLAVVLCLMMGINTRRRSWFIAGGVVLGLGMYTYNIYPVAVLAVLVFVAILTWTRFRGVDWHWWRDSMLVFWGVGLLVAIPMLFEIADPDSFYWFHIRNYGDVRVTQIPEYQDADLWGKLELIARQVETFLGAYGWDGELDIVDGNGIRPMFDSATGILLLFGLIMVWRRRSDPVVLAALCCLLIVPLPAVLQRGSIMRQPLAAAPYAMFFAALPLAVAWQGGLRLLESSRPRGFALCAGAAALLALITTVTVHDYFWTWRNHPFTREIYASEMATASDYMDRLPDDTYVLFASARWPLSIEIRQFLAPDVEGEDRSSEYSDRGRDIEVPDSSRPTVFVLLDNYVDLLPEIQAAYPGGVERVFTRDNKFEFVAYEIPPHESSDP
jgi:4-amino-4-deoxy-L-arabinose transferase-like glycosyltransferase